MTLEESFLRTAIGEFSTEWPYHAEDEFQDSFLETCFHHGTQHVLLQKLTETGRFQRWPLRVQAALTNAAKNDSALETIRRLELLEVLSALEEKRIRPLLMKGTPIAYNYYSQPYSRVRSDTDLLVRREQFPLVAQTLKNLGYSGPDNIEVEFVTYQANFSKVDRYDVPHELDMHWKINNAQRFAHTFDYDELIEKSVAVPGLGKHAITLGAVHSLLLACMHRVAHVHAPLYLDDRTINAEERLIWLYDIHLLAESMSRDDWDEVLLLADSRHLCGVCRHSLDMVSEIFDTNIPDRVISVLNTASPNAYSDNQMRNNPARSFIQDLQSLENFRQKFVFLKETFFPAPAQVLEKYGFENRYWLPLLYLYRAILGVQKRVFSQNP